MKDNISNHQLDPFFISNMDLLCKKKGKKLTFPQLSKQRPETVRNAQVARDDSEAACKELKPSSSTFPSIRVL